MVKQPVLYFRASGERINDFARDGRWNDSRTVAFSRDEFGL